jgi:hypothetical protein
MTTAIADALRIASGDCSVVVLKADATQDIYARFVANTALAGCTHTEPLGNGDVAVITDRPVTTLSTGERLLWEFLVSLTGPTGCTPGVDVGLLAERVDAVNLAAVADLFARLTFLRSAS